MFLPFIISEHLPRKKRTYLGQRSGQVSSPYFSQVENHLTCSKQSPPPPLSPPAAKIKVQLRFMLTEDGTFRKQEASNTDSKSRRWSKRAFQRRSSEIEVRLHRTSLTGSQGHSSVDGPKSPTTSRRRSSSIAVARPTPDLHR